MSVSSSSQVVRDAISMMRQRHNTKLRQNKEQMTAIENQINALKEDLSSKQCAEIRMIKEHTQELDPLLQQLVLLEGFKDKYEARDALPM
jgi:transcription elongation GreA/GreB family factor